MHAFTEHHAFVKSIIPNRINFTSVTLRKKEFTMY